MKKMDVVSFFAGCGGLDLGFEMAGFRVTWANDFEPHCRATYVRNHCNTEFVLGDVCQIDSSSIPNCDGFIGGPPCQSWSVGGKQNGLDDSRGQLFLKYIELIGIKKPKFFVIENVKGMLDDKFKNVFNGFVNKLDRAGYNVKWSLLDAANYSTPQNRERVFFVGFRKDLYVNFTFPNPTCSEPITLEMAIGDITEKPNYFPSGTNNGTLPNSNTRPNHDVLSSKFGSFYYRGNRRRGWHQPSFTINATAEFAPLHPSSPKMFYLGHENWTFQKEKINDYRRLSVRECARIQTFPDDFIFEYTDIRDAYKMIGNAVPPRLALMIAKAILSALEGITIEQTVSLSPQNDPKDACTLVGYYKNENHRSLILQNLLYYVRSDGRKGSMFKQDCSVMPEYLLLYHKDKTEIYELDTEEPMLTDSSFLRALGFETTGDKYLCFRLKNAVPKSMNELVGPDSVPAIHQRNYSPYFTTIYQLFNSKI